MERLYRFTNTLIPEIKSAAPVEFPVIFEQLDKLQGLHPTTLEELLDKLSILKERGIEVEAIKISPIVEEGGIVTLYAYEPTQHHAKPLPSGPVSIDTYFYLNYVARLSNGVSISVWDRIKCNIAFKDKTKYDNSFFTQGILEDAKRNLEVLAKQQASALRQLGYNAIVSYTIQKDKDTVCKMIADFFGS